MIAFKTYRDCPNNIKPISVPDEWVWVQLEIPDNQKEVFEAEGYTVLSFQDFNAYKATRQTAFDVWANAYDVDRVGQELLVMEYVDDKYAAFSPSKIDFRLHLKENIYFQKNVVMLPNGRPQKSLYTFNGVLIAEIEFAFEVNQFNFMTRRTEKLSYYKRNGTQSDKWIIADDVYDINNPYHLREMMKERSESRSLILEGVKAFLNGVLAAYYVPQGKTYPEILSIAGDFWGAYSNDIDSWINVGSPKFGENLNSDNTFAFLSVTVAAGVTVRQYIISKISY